MNIKLTGILAAVAIGILTTSGIFQPASAQQQQGQGIKINKRALEKVEYYHAPLQIQLVNTDPVVTDHRTAPQNESFNIVIPPLPGAQSGIANSGKSLPAGGIRVGNPTPVVVRGGGLPRSSFGSNIPARSAVAGNLPDAKSTNRLGNSYKQTAAGHLANKPSSPTLAAKPSAPTPVLTYKTTFSPGVASGTTQTSTSVSGVIKKRGSLLGN